jgi:hypothetical protein
MSMKEATDEIKRLKNIISIQQKQIERLMDARDAEIIKNRKLSEELKKQK